MHTGEPVAQIADALARPASNNMPLSEHDTQELRRLLYLKAEGNECQERLQYLRQTWKSSIWSEEDDDSYTLPDPEIPLVYSLHYGQQCPPEWDDGSVPVETADRHKKKEHGKSNLHAEEDFLLKLESLNLDPRLEKLLITYEEVFGALPPPLSCKKLVQMDLKLKPEFEKTQVRRRPYPAPQEQVEEIERQIQECIDAGLVEEYKKGDYPLTAVPVSWLPNQDRLPSDWWLTMVKSTRKPRTTQGVFVTWKIPWSVSPNAGTRPKWTNTLVSGRWT